MSNKNYKLVAIDCDNTLIKHNGEVHKDNIKAINMLLNQGVKVVIATGRNDILVKDYLYDIGLKEEIVIGCNGASIRDLKENKIIKVNYIPKDIAKKILNICIENGIDAKMYTFTKSYALNEEDAKDELKEILTHYTKELSTYLEYKYEKDIDKLIEKEDFLKIVIAGTDTEKLLEIRDSFKKFEDINAVMSTRFSLDIMKKGVSKGEALKEYANIFNIKSEEIVAIGDSENDLDMLSFAGFSVAMGNGEDFVKKACDIVTLTNDEGGVAYAINKIFNYE